MTPDIPERESLTVEFKSDRNRLNDRDLIAAVVCLANTDGGDLYLGIEDDGTVTGLHPAHQNLSGLTALIANLTSPPLTVRVEAMDVESRRIARISVPKSRQLVATSDGLMQRRRLRADGLPECVPFYPHEFAQRQSDLGLLDYSQLLPVPSASQQDFDPLERERLRQCIERYGGERSLIGLADEELDGALGLIRRDEGGLCRPWPVCSFSVEKRRYESISPPMRSLSRFWMALRFVSTTFTGHPFSRRSSASTNNFGYA